MKQNGLHKKGHSIEAFNEFKSEHTLMSSQQDRALSESPWESLATYVLSMTTPFGGLPIAMPLRYLMRSWPEPVAETGVAWKMAAKGGVGECETHYESL